MEYASDKQRVKTIVHIDMNAFYCACHQANNPPMYQGKPTAVAGNPETRHGILVTASYEARAFGVRATMTVAEAKRKCPALILIAPNFDLYRAYSARVFAIARDFTPAVEIFSIDECFADMTGSSQFGTPIEIAQQIQRRILQELRLPCSIGIAPNRFLAKMASDFKKPLGITEIHSQTIATLLWPLPIEEMFGVGKQTSTRLRRLGITTIGELAQFDVDKLIRMFGVRGRILSEHANGIDMTPVDANHNIAKNIGHSMTLSVDTNDHNEIEIILLNLCDQVGRRVRTHDLMGRTITVTIRFNNLRTITRNHTRPFGTNLTEDIYTHAKELVFANLHPWQKIRLLGVSLGQLAQNELSPPAQRVIQTNLFDEPILGFPIQEDKQSIRLRKLTEVTDRLRNRFGEDKVIRGSMLLQHESGQIRNRKIRGTSLQKDDL